MGVHNGDIASPALFERSVVLALVSMLLIILLAFVVTGGIALALSGALEDRAPVLHARLVEVTRHMNGDADAPERLQRLFGN